jgi:hypothetical protein
MGRGTVARFRAVQYHRRALRGIDVLTPVEHVARPAAGARSSLKAET